MKRGMILLLLCLFVVGSVFAGGRRQQQDDGLMVLRVGLASHSGTFDPQNGTTATPQYIINQAYRGLFRFDPDGYIIPALALRYEVSANGLVYTFHLRPGAVWSDGVPVRAQDFIFGWQRNFEPALRAPYIGLFNGLVNYDRFLDGLATVRDLGMRAVNDHTLEVTLSRTQPYFVAMTTFSPFFPMREDFHPRDSSAYSIQPDLRNLVTTGPFKFESYSANERIVLVRNPLYWDAHRVQIDRLYFYFIPSPAASVAAYNAGDIDIAINVPQTVVDVFARPEEVVVVPVLSNSTIVFNARHPQFSDRRVREAIAIAIERQEMADVLGGGITPLRAMIPPGITNPATGRDFREEGGDLIIEDIPRARRLLAEAGFPNGQGFPTVEFLFNNDSHNWVLISQMLQEQLRRNLNINVTLRGHEWATFRNDRNSGQHEFVRHGTTADYVDPTTWFNLYISNRPLSQAMVGNHTPEFDALVAYSDTILDPGRRFEVLHQVERLLMRDLYWVPLVQMPMPFLQRPFVHGAHPGSSSSICLAYAWVTR